MGCFALVSGRILSKTVKLTMASNRPSSNLAAFRTVLHEAKNVVALTGAGTSAESGIPTFRGSGGFWRTYQAQDLASPMAFKANPSLVWEFYHYRRELVNKSNPNQAHYALSEAQKVFEEAGKSFKVVTQNIDGLHQKAGSTDVIELHGSLFKTRCTKCRQVETNFESPICSALAGKGAPDADVRTERIAEKDLPRCKSCDGLLRPHVVWFGENLEKSILDRTDNLLSECDLCLVVGTSSVVYPAAMFAPQVAERGVPVAEFNIEPTPSTFKFGYYFEGPCGTTLPHALSL